MRVVEEGRMGVLPLAVEDASCGRGVDVRLGGRRREVERGVSSARALPADMRRSRRLA